jgi:transcriptional regulator with XRE-family HTH domain
MSNFAEIIKAGRKKKRMTQRKMALLLGVSQQTINHWEQGGIPRGSRIADISQLLEVNLISRVENYSDVIYGEDGQRKREWVGLTLDDMDTLEISREWLAGARWAEAKLKEKNT